MNEDDFQMMAMQIAVNADTGDSSHMRGSPPKRIQTSLMNPYSVWKNHAQMSRRMQAAAPTAATAPAHRPLPFERQVGKQREARPTSSAPGTVTSGDQHRIPVASQKAPSLIMSAWFASQPISNPVRRTGAVSKKLL